MPRPPQDSRLRSPVHPERSQSLVFHYATAHGPFSFYTKHKSRIGSRDKCLHISAPTTRTTGCRQQTKKTSNVSRQRVAAFKRRAHVPFLRCGGSCSIPGRPSGFGKRSTRGTSATTKTVARNSR